MTRTTLGELEELILLTLLRLGGRSYSVPVAEELEERTGRRVSPTAVYVVFRRLEDRGFLDSSLGTADEARGGRPPRHFEICSEALPLLRRSMRSRQALWDGLEPVLEEGS